MHVNAKKMAFAGIALALTVIFIVLSGILEINTLFLLAAASFSIGIIIREFGSGFGLAFFIAAVLLGVILAPNKLYCITFAAMGLYILLVELSWIFLSKSGKKHKIRIFWLLKYLIFNILYIPMLLFFPKLLFAGEIHQAFIIAALVLGQAALFLYDKAYDYFQMHLWSKWRKFVI